MKNIGKTITFGMNLKLTNWTRKTFELISVRNFGIYIIRIVRWYSFMVPQQKIKCFYIMP